MSSEQQQKNVLVEISNESLLKLRDLYKINLPKHIIAYNFIENMIKRFIEHPKDVKVYCINGKVEDDATFISLVHDNDVVFDTLDSTLDQLQLVLKLHDYTEKSHFVCVKNDYRNVLLHFIANGCFEKTLWDDQTAMFYLKREDALKIEISIPGGLHVNSLSKANAEKVNSIWPHASPGSVKFISHCIEHNPSVGVYNENNELLSWCLYQDFGCLLAFQTDPNHLRKGYGELAARAITKKVAEELKVDCVANVFLNNIKSINVFKKIGFHQIDTNSWIGVKTL